MNNIIISQLIYQITEQLYSGSRTLVYRAKQQSDSKPVVIKLMRSEYPNFRELLQFRNQYTITKNIKFSGIISSYKLEPYQNAYALIMEDFGGISLKQYIHDYSPGLIEFLEMAIQLAEILEQLYKNRVIHKDIKPDNILINPDTKQIKLIDFSIASLLPRETQEIQNPNVLEGTLAYLSPEQTGRMNRGIDYRSDFYALGVTFYELLTGQVPFKSEDPMELIHCHLAQNPPKVHDLNPEIPPIISDLVDKLMAKNAENRYQSALGLKNDLEICLQQLKDTGDIQNFKLGIRDIPDGFVIPEKLYGRQSEVKTLLDAFDRVAQGSIEMMLVAGFSGIGKTAVVNEVHKPIVRQRGYFIKGKFDQFQRNNPFSAFVQAFRELMSQLLGETETKLQEWKHTILKAVGENGQVLIDVIPELEYIIGKQPPVPELSGNAAQNRFNLLFQKFIQVFTTQEHPLVIFLDDLQWIDSASLKLIQLLMSETESHYLLLIGAYRDNEVDSAHPLMLTLEEIQKTSAVIHTIILDPLKLYLDVNPLVADTLHCSHELALPLSKLIHQKTKGNPFFITQFLKALYEEKIINFNQEEGYWECDIAEVSRLSLTDDIVEFMANRLQKLDIKTQNLLKLAACIGNKFELETLAIVYEKSTTETATDLWVALQEGLIIPITEVYKFYTTTETHLDRPFKSVNPSVSYKFLHDRVQQASYFLIPEDKKQETHLKIGQLLLQNTPEEEQEENIFNIVNQLNIGLSLIKTQTERDELAQLNLIAGRKAKSSTAYNAAVEYLTTGLELLSNESWQRQYDLTFNLHVETAESEYLTSRFQSGYFRIETIITNAMNLIDQCVAYELKIQMYIAQAMMQEAIDTTLYALEKLEINLTSELDNQFAIEDLIHLPTMTAPDQLAAMQILMTVIPAAYVAQPELLLPVTVTMVQLSINEGNSPIAAFSYVFYGVLLCGFLGDIASGYQFGQLSLKVLDKFDAIVLKSKIYHLFYAMVNPWKSAIIEVIKPLNESIQVGLETGDIEYASYSVADYCNYKFLRGESLDDVYSVYSQYLELSKKLQPEYMVNYIDIWGQVCRNLTDQNLDSCSISIQGLSEVEMLDWLKESQQMIALFAAHFGKLFLCYLFQDYTQAVKSAQIAEEYVNYLVGKIYGAEHNFYSSLALLGLATQTETSERQDYLDQVEENQKKLRTWADHAPMNYLHKFNLVEAERHRILGQFVEAMELYDRAIAGAKENEYIQEEALANELAAKFYLEWGFDSAQPNGKETIAQAYLINAYYSYARWTAQAKVEDLEKRYPRLLAPILNSNSSHLKPHNTIKSLAKETLTNTTSGSSMLLDFITVMKASQAISEEIELDKLISTLMKVTLNNAGAQKGCLILNNQGNLEIEALATCHTSHLEDLKLSSMESLPLELCLEVPKTLIRYVARTQKSLVIDQIMQETQFTSDPYLQEHQPKSIFCIPVVNRGKFIGILYLENNLTVGAFTSERVEVLNILTAQAAISLENARLYDQITVTNKKLEEYNHNLEQKVSERTQELEHKNQDLSQTLEQLQRTQAQLIQTEKLSSLGQMVAGIAHEINNPVSFISGNVHYAREYVKDLLSLIEVYQQEYPTPTPSIEEIISEIDPDFLIEDLHKVLNSMKVGADRIQKIVQALRTFSRLDESQLKSVDLHDGLESTLLILQNRLKPQKKRPEIKIIKNYSRLPLVNCYAAQVNQVLMNVLSNAIDALNDAWEKNPISGFKPQITIQTEFIVDFFVKIRIADNGCGMSEAVQQKIFDPFFTTKPVGSGTGLGLSIAHSIIVEKHHGQLTCQSTLGKGTEFIIELPTRFVGD